VVALGASVVVVSPRGERRIAAQDFFTGLLSTALAADELIAAVEVPVADAGHRVAIEEVARRSGDYAMAGLAAWVDMAGGRVAAARLVFFGVGAGPVLAAGAGAALVGQVPDAGAVAAAQAALAGDLDPPGDMHGPPEMKMHLARVLLGRVLSPMTSGEIAA
jgi:carbon-monoxide dehydrogenase medium subunit